MSEVPMYPVQPAGKSAHLPMRPECLPSGRGCVAGMLTSSLGEGCSLLRGGGGEGGRDREREREREEAPPALRPPSGHTPGYIGAGGSSRCFTEPKKAWVAAKFGS